MSRRGSASTGAGHAHAFLDSLLAPRNGASTSQTPFSSSAASSTASSSSQAHLAPTFKPHKPSSLSSSASASASEDGAERARTSRSGAQADDDTSGADEDDDDDDSAVGTSPSFSSSFKAAQISMQTLHNHLSTPSFSNPSLPASASQGQDRVSEIMTLLKDRDMDEEDRIEKVRASLASALFASEGVVTSSSRLDNLVLDLLHRHREDINPTGATFSSVPVQSPIRRPASIRSFSASRPWTPSKPPYSPAQAAFDASPSTPQQATSPLLSSVGLPASATIPPGLSSLGSPKPHPGVIGSGSPRASPRPWNRTLSNLSTTSVASSNGANTSVGSPISSLLPNLAGSRPASPSPFGSPRLNVAATEFRPKNSSTTSSVSGSGFTPTRPSPWLARRPSSNASSTNLALANKSHAGAGDDDDDEFSPFGSSKPPPAQLAPHGGLEGEMGWYSSGASATSSNGGYDPSPLSSAAAVASCNVTVATSVEEGAEGGAPGSMTPFDLLYSILVSGTKQGMAEWSPDQVEEVLAANGYDFEKTLNAIWENGGKPLSAAKVPGAPDSPSLGSATVSPPAGIRSGVNVLPRETFQWSNRAPSKWNGRPGPSLSSPGVRSPSFAPPPAVANNAMSGGIGGSRVCRYFLAGECRRSDCKFSHDLSRAVCRYWLKGQCAHNPCNFLHDYDALNMLASGITSGARLNGDEDGGDLTDQYSPDVGDSFDSRPTPTQNEEFPVLVGGPKARGNKASMAADPTKNRWSTAVQKKANSPLAMLQQEDQAYISLHSKGGPSRSVSSQKQAGGGSAGRVAGRIPLRAPLLLPTLNTGKHSAQTYAVHRDDSLALADQRNKILARASDAFRRGDFSAAKKWSQEASLINSQFQEESRSAARRLLKQRMKEIRAKVTDPIEAGWLVNSNQSQEPGARGMKGKMVGNGLGVCLGVVRPAALRASMPSSMAHNLSAEERSESLLDLHGLHSQEAVEMVEEFLLGLESESVQGLAYLAVGREKHSSKSTDKRRVKLAGFIKQFLSSYGYPFAEWDGVLVVDQCTHV